MRRSLMVICVVVVLAIGEVGLTQTAKRGELGAHDPGVSLPALVYAQAELMRAGAQTRKMQAEARSEEAVARINEKSADAFNAETYWSMRDQWDRETLKRRGTPLNNQKKRNLATWSMLKDHPEMAGQAVPQGRALTFLLQRLSGTLLAYHFGGGEPAVSPEVLAGLKLDDRLLHAVRLKQIGQGNEQRIFRADGTGGLEGRWWPYLLRFDELSDARRRFEDAREMVVAQVERGYEVDVKNLQRLESALRELSAAFFQKFPPGAAAKVSIEHFVQVRAADSFLRDLDRQVKRLQASGDVRGLRPQFYDPVAAGKNLVNLLTYMSRNGTEFAPAEPGDEEAYSQLFVMMRDLYVEVADEDAGIQPKSSQELVQEKFGDAKPKPKAPAPVK